MTQPGQRCKAGLPDALGERRLQVQLGGTLRVQRGDGRATGELVPEGVEGPAQRPEPRCSGVAKRRPGRLAPLEGAGQLLALLLRIFGPTAPKQVDLPLRTQEQGVQVAAKARELCEPR